MEDKNRLARGICAIVGHDWDPQVVHCKRCDFKLLEITVNGMRLTLWIDFNIQNDSIRFYDHMDKTDRIVINYVHESAGTLFTYSQYADNHPIKISHLP